MYSPLLWFATTVHVHSALLAGAALVMGVGAADGDGGAEAAATHRADRCSMTHQQATVLTTAATLPPRSAILLRRLLFATRVQVAPSQQAG